jgi:hypothetical protein
MTEIVFWGLSLGPPRMRTGGGIWYPRKSKGSSKDLARVVFLTWRPIFSYEGSNKNPAGAAL